MFFIGLITWLIIWTQSSMANVLSIFSLLVFTTALWGRYFYCMLYMRTLRGWEDQVLAKGNAFAKVQGQDFDPYLFNGKSLPALLEFWELFCSKPVFTAQTSCSKTLESERGANLSTCKPDWCKPICLRLVLVCCALEKLERPKPLWNLCCYWAKGWAGVPIV